MCTWNYCHRGIVTGRKTSRRCYGDTDGRFFSFTRTIITTTTYNIFFSTRTKRSPVFASVGRAFQSHRDDLNDANGRLFFVNAQRVWKFTSTLENEVTKKKKKTKKNNRRWKPKIYCRGGLAITSMWKILDSVNE